MKFSLDIQTGTLALGNTKGSIFVWDIERDPEDEPRDKPNPAAAGGRSRRHLLAA